MDGLVMKRLGITQDGPNMFFMGWKLTPNVIAGHTLYTISRQGRSYPSLNLTRALDTIRATVTA